MGLVRCEACGKDIEAGWNLSQHLIGKDHLKKLARWQGEHLPYHQVMPAEVVHMTFNDSHDWEDGYEPTRPTTTSQKLATFSQPSPQQPLPVRQVPQQSPPTRAVLKLRAPIPTPPPPTSSSPYFPSPTQQP